MESEITFTGETGVYLKLMYANVIEFMKLRACKVSTIWHRLLNSWVLFLYFVVHYDLPVLFFSSNFVLKRCIIK